MKAPRICFFTTPKGANVTNHYVIDSENWAVYQHKNEVMAVYDKKNTRLTVYFTWYQHAQVKTNLMKFINQYCQGLKVANITSLYMLIGKDPHFIKSYNSLTGEGQITWLK